ncbi:unnamed protein product [Heligmosomoides polygyrus]|uniref:tRNA-synt_2 domain-containing protein n=1 Tax=Heligmosomoides polygyrus TaxID=6339 RepID=A0A183FVP8_HELPZ|nr:unnamed protein product [Heligmosomoides polygyrus]
MNGVEALKGWQLFETLTVQGEISTYISTAKRASIRFRGGDMDFGLEVQHMETFIALEAVKEDPEVSTRSPAMRLRCSHPTVLSRLQSLGYRKVLTRCVPHVLSESM